jgi:uncharacterized protein (TIGR03663 family)
MRFTTPTTTLRWAIFIGIALLALAVRLPQLSGRPLHTDEAVNAYRTGELLAGEGFRYDPQDRHGPALFVFAEPLVKFLGAKNFADLTEAQLRLTPVIFGSLTVLLLGASVEMFGFLACLVAALLFAVSPLPVYYSRYFIHETPFVTMTLGGLIAAWQAWQKKSVLAAVIAGLCAALMLACKETSVIHFVALLAAFVCVARMPLREKSPPLKIIAVALAVFLVASIALLTWFGSNWAVFADLLRAVPSFTARAGGEGHAKSFGYYFHLLDSTFILFLLAIAGIYAAIFDACNGGRKTGLLLVIYGGLVTLTYAAIPYKTPWLALNLWLPMTLLCGLGVAAFWEQIKSPAGHWGIGLAGIFLLSTLGNQTKQFAFDEPAGEKNPYAYAHTGDDIFRLAPRLEQLAQQEKIPQPLIAVVATDSWPLPWYLRKFARVGYWQPGQDPGPADFLITSSDVPEDLTERVRKLRPEFFGVRPNVLIILWTPASLSQHE